MPVTEWTPADEFDGRQGGRAIRVERHVAKLLLGCLLLQLVGLTPVGYSLLTEGSIDATFFGFDPSAQNAGQRRFLHSLYAGLISLSVCVSATAAIDALRSWDIIEQYWVLSAVSMWIFVCAECLALAVCFYINW